MELKGIALEDDAQLIAAYKPLVEQQFAEAENFKPYALKMYSGICMWTCRGFKTTKKQIMNNFKLEGKKENERNDYGSGHQQCTWH